MKVFIICNNCGGKGFIRKRLLGICMRRKCITCRGSGKVQVKKDDYKL